MDRLLANSQGVVTLRVYDGNGDLVDLDTPPTVTVRSGAGVTLGTPSAATRVSIGRYTYTLDPTHTATLDEITLDWQGALGGVNADFLTTALVVSAHPVTLAELRATHKELANETKYPDDAVVEARDTATERLERALKVAITPAGYRETISGDGSSLLIVAKREVSAVYSVTVDGVAVTGYTIEPWGGLRFTDGQVWTAGTRNVSVHYRHGWAEAPLPVRRAVRLLAAEMLIPSSMPARATSLATDAGQFRLSVAGRDGYTGLPEVDAVIDQFGQAAPAVG